MNENQIALFDEKGELKTKDQFLNEMGEVYDSCIEHIEHIEHEEVANTLFDLVSSPETQLDVPNAFENFNYYTKDIYITGEITQDTANMIFKRIRFYNKIDQMHMIPKEERTPIRIIINSSGGNLDASLSIISVIKTSTTPVYTYNIGEACSGAFFILISGHKRFGLPYTTYLYHEGSCGTFGDAHKFINFAEYYQKELKQIKKIVLKYTQITEEEYEERRKDDWWFDADDAYMYDIIDEIINSIDQLDCYEEEKEDELPNE